MICPLLSIIFFDTRKFPENRRGPLQSFSFRSCETKSSDKTVMPPPMHENFRQKNFFETPKCSPMKYFGTVRQKLRRKIVILPTLSKLFDTRNYCNSKGFPYGNFRHCETKTFRRKMLKLPLPPLIHKLFRYRKFFEAQQRRIHLPNFSALWDKKFSTENLDTPSPLSDA